MMESPSVKLYAQLCSQRLEFITENQFCYNLSELCTRAGFDNITHALQQTRFRHPCETWTHIECGYESFYTIMKKLLGTNRSCYSIFTSGRYVAAGIDLSQARARDVTRLMDQLNEVIQCGIRCSLHPPLPRLRETFLIIRCPLRNVTVPVERCQTLTHLKQDYDVPRSAWCECENEHQIRTQRTAHDG